MTIDILEIPKKESFPIISFKFLNSGNAAAVLWKFIVEVLDSQVDITPEFEFSYLVEPSGSLRIQGTNVGWGAAIDFQGSVEFSSKCGSWRQSAHFDLVPKWADGEASSFEVCENLILREEMQGLRGQSELSMYVDPKERMLYCFPLGHTKAERHFIMLDTPKVHWSCKSVNGEHTAGESEVNPPSSGFLALGKDGFYFCPIFLSACTFGPFTRYCSILDVEQKKLSS